MVNRTIIYIFLFALTSCEKELNVVFPYVGDKLIVFAELKLDAPIRAQISKTSNPNESINLNNYIDDLIVLVKKGETIFDTLRYVNNNVYLGNNIVNVAGKYSIIIISKELGEIESEEIESIQPNFNLQVKNNGKVVSKLNPSVKTNRFEIKVFGSVENGYYYKVNVTIPKRITFLRKTPVEQNQEIANECSSFISDLSYIRKSKCVLDSFKISYDIELKYYNEDLKKSIEPDSLIVNVEKFDETYFKYISGITDNNFLENAFKTPVLFESNFLNGLGIFYPIQSKTIMLYKGKDY